MQVTKLEALTRVGFAARGVLYILIGFLALKTGSAEGNGGALQYLNSGGGKLLLALMALGFLGYGFWRLSEALLDTEGHGDDPKGIAVRVGGFVSGLLHLGLAIFAARLVAGGGSGGGSSNGAEQSAQATLALPGGQTLLAVAAALLLVTGLYQFAKAARLGFLRHIDARAAKESWVRWSGRLGYAARGVVFLMLAYFLWNAAQQGNAQKAGDTGEALQALPSWVQISVAAGLLLFGLFSLVEARYRRINDPQVLERLGSRTAALSS